MYFQVTKFLIVNSGAFCHDVELGARRGNSSMGILVRNRFIELTVSWIGTGLSSDSLITMEAIFSPNFCAVSTVVNV